MVKPVVAVLLLCAISLAQQDTSSREAAAAPQAQGFKSGQKSVPDKKVSQPPVPKPLPLYDVVLSPNPDVSIILSDQFEAVAEGCDGSGNPYFSISQHDEMEVAALTKKGVVSFNARKVTDVSPLTFVKPFVASSELYMLAIWIDPAKLAEKGKDSDPVRDFMTAGGGEGNFYIVRFDLDGSYKRALKLDFEFLPMQFAALEGGNLLVAGLGKSRAAHVAMLDSSGQLLNYLRLPKDVAENPSAASESFALFGMNRTEKEASPEEIAVFASTSYHRGNILFRRAADPSRIYEVRNTGEVRTVRVKDARARSFDDMLQSDQNWFAYAKQDELYEISSRTGELLGHYRLKNKIERKDQIACVYQGKFIGTRQTMGKLTLLTGVAEPTTENSENVVQQQ